MRLSNIDLVWRPEAGWCVTMTGPQGESGFLMPILVYMRALHDFFGKPGDPFGQPLLEAKAAKPPRITKRKKKSRKRG